MLLFVIDFLINARQFIANQQINTTFATKCIILTIIHWKNSINLMIYSQKIYLYIVIVDIEDQGLNLIKKN